jgi:hypothetical protein
MKLKKNEKILLIVLAIIIIIFGNFRFVYQPKLQDINEKSRLLLEKTTKKEQLDSNLINIKSIKNYRDKRNNYKEKLDSLLIMNNMITESMQLLDKLTNKINKTLQRVSITPPEENDFELGKSKIKYYKTDIFFDSILTDTEFFEMIKFFRSFTNQIKITKLELESIGDKAKQKLELEEDGLLFSTSIGLSMYSLINPDINPVFNNDNKYTDTGSQDIIFTENNFGDLEEEEIIEYVQNSLMDTGKKALDLLIQARSFLTAGNNIQVYGMDILRDVIETKTKEEVYINLFLDNDTYRVNANVSGNTIGEFEGFFEKSSFNIDFNINIPDIQENSNIKIIIIIENNTEKNINILNTDSENIIIRERNGKEIANDNNSENIKFIY